ncbi:MAG: RHS repeat-associated core domain-containing protein [Bacteroidota bacterium]|nr:RHS repeat-associated core domain-containing protein [Bacteroidota bacterium]
MFELTDHLGNVRSVIAKNVSNSTVDVLSYSDYYPHGGVLPGRNFVSSPSYKQGYQGKEKDPETNFTNFELRQLDPRLGRWFNPDPMGQYFSPYLAMGNNPVSSIDPTGGYNTSLDFDLDAIYSDGASTHSGYSSEDPFTAWERYNASQQDNSLSAEIRQGYADFMENHLSMKSLIRDIKFGQYTHSTLDGGYGTWSKHATTGVAEGSDGSSQGYIFLGAHEVFNLVVSDEDIARYHMQQEGSVMYFMHGMFDGVGDAVGGAIMFGARDMFRAETWKNMGNLMYTMSAFGVADGSAKNFADGLFDKARNADAYDWGNFTGQVGVAVLADKGMGAIAEAGTVVEASTAVIGEVNAAKNGASLSSNGAKLSEHLGQVEKYGQGGVKALENGKYRYYGEISPATKPGEMVGRRVVREWNPSNGNKRTWMETLDGSGNTRIVRPENGGTKTHYMFDKSGNYTGKW